MSEQYSPQGIRRQCSNKKRFSQNKAMVVAQEMSARTGEYLHAYYCVICGNWHVGHGTRCRIVVEGEEG